MGIIERVRQAVPELAHCTFYELLWRGEALCVAVDFSLRGVWTFRADLQGVRPEHDPELAWYSR
ncbi:hypothetical protein ACWGI9_45475 [Streptomyces sp. NPDC054833]